MAHYRISRVGQNGKKYYLRAHHYSTDTKPISSKFIWTSDRSKAMDIASPWHASLLVEQIPGRYSPWIEMIEDQSEYKTNHLNSYVWLSVA